MFADDVNGLPETLSSVWNAGHVAGLPRGLLTAQRLRFAGMGASYAAALAASTTLRELGIVAEAELASSLLHFGLPAASADDWFVLVSQSGESVETVRAAEALRAKGCLNTVAVTNNPSSRLAALCGVTCELGSQADALVAVRSYSATYLVLYKIGLALAGTAAPDIDPALREAVAVTAASHAAAKEIVDGLPVPRFIETLGRGPLLGVALQASIVLREVCKIASAPWEAGDFRHGPVESCHPEEAIILFAGGPASGVGELDRALGEMIAGTGARVVTVGPPPATVPVCAAEAFRPVLDLIPVCHLAALWAENTGCKPGTFRWAAHVTTSES